MITHAACHFVRKVAALSFTFERDDNATMFRPVIIPRNVIAISTGRERDVPSVPSMIIGLH